MFCSVFRKIPWYFCELEDSKKKVTWVGVEKEKWSSFRARSSGDYLTWNRRPFITSFPKRNPLSKECSMADLSSDEQCNAFFCSGLFKVSHRRQNSSLPTNPSQNVWQNIAIHLALTTGAMQLLFLYAIISGRWRSVLSWPVLLATNQNTYSSLTWSMWKWDSLTGDAP